jgi:FG-GAP repeat.
LRFMSSRRSRWKRKRIPGHGRLRLVDAAWKREVVDSSTHAGALVWADFDGDGSDELAVSSESGIHLYKRLAGGGWSKTQIGSGPAVTLTAGDLNGDGLPELIAGGKTGLRIFWNEIERPWVRHAIVGGFRTQSAVAADFTGHGRLDVISGDIENDRNIYPLQRA